MVSKLDDSVGQIVEALQTKGVLHKSIILFFSDNGAQTIGTNPNWGSNYPLRGQKDTLFEGGVRSASFLYSPLIIQNGRVSKNLVHVTDWLPTLYSAVLNDISNLDSEMDGLDQWASMLYDFPSARSELLINIDDLSRNAALIFSQYKLIVGTTYDGAYNIYLGDSGTENIYEVPYNKTAVVESVASKNIQPLGSTAVYEYDQLRNFATLKCSSALMHPNTPCDASGSSVCLYDMEHDPCETNNLASYLKYVVKDMKKRIVRYRLDLKSQLNKEPDIDRADPQLFNYTWNPWLNCFDNDCTM